MSLPSRIPEPVRKVIVRDYEQGMSLFHVQAKYKSIPRRLVRDLLREEGVMRDQDCIRKEDPTPEYLIQERERFKNSWSPQEASSRWVGRTNSQVAMDRMRAASRLMPD